MTKNEIQNFFPTIFIEYTILAVPIPIVYERGFPVMKSQKKKQRKKILIF